MAAVIRCRVEALPVPTRHRIVDASSVLRWTARAWSAASLALIMAFIVGEGVSPSSRGEWIGFLFFPLGISVGMIVAWWKEGLGGAMTVLCLAVFYALHFVTAGAVPPGLAWLVFAAPGFLFLSAWFLSRTPSPSGRSAHV